MREGTRDGQHKRQRKERKEKQEKAVEMKEQKATEGKEKNQKDRDPNKEGRNKTHKDYPKKEASSLRSGMKHRENCPEGAGENATDSQCGREKTQYDMLT